MPKIVFIEPKAPNLHIFSRFYTPRLGSFILGALMKERGWDVEVMIEELNPLSFEDIASADVVGLSTITPTAPRAYAIAQKIKKLYPDVQVVMGGPHVTYLPEEALEHADFVIRGEGEDALVALAGVLEENGDLATVPNLSYKIDDAIVHNPKEEVCINLDRLPLPDFSLLNGENSAFGPLNVIPVQTSRGCPFDCSFCSVTGMFGKKYRFRSTENIVEELRRYDKQSNFIFFYDDNLTAHPSRAKQLFRAMIREKFKFKWSAQVRADVAKDKELVKLMKKAGCHTLFIGFESVNPETLKSMKKSQTVQEIAAAIKTIHRHHINIHGMFVYGFDDDDWKTVKQTVKFARKYRLTSSQFLILTPFPGSEFYDKARAEHRIRFKDWALYDAHHVVFEPAHLFPVDLQRAQIFSHKKFYSLREMARKLWHGNWISLPLAHYARRLNRGWLRKNKTFLQVVKLLTPNKRSSISIDYREKVCLDDAP